MFFASLSILAAAAAAAPTAATATATTATIVGFVVTIHTSAAKNSIFVASATIRKSCHVAKAALIFYF